MCSSDGTKYPYISVEILGISIGIFQPIPGIGYKMQLHVKKNWNFFSHFLKKIWKFFEENFKLFFQVCFIHHFNFVI